MVPAVINVPKSASLATLSFIGVLVASPGASASELTGHATVTSQYIYRGLAFSDGHPAFQLGGHLDFESGFFVGAWTSSIDLEGPTSRRTMELDYYAGYSLTTDSPWSASITAVRYTYPMAEGAHSYDYNEVLLALSFSDRYSLEAGYTDNVYNLDAEARHWALRADWPLADTLVVGAGLGGHDLAGLGVAHYLHWDLGLSARLSRFTFDLRWYDNEEPDRLPFSGISAGSQLVLSLSLGL